MSEITMPRLSESMEQGTILRWLIADGQPVARGDELVEIETDKATVAYEAEREGVLRIAEPEGAAVVVGAVIARLDAAGADAPSAASGAGGPAESGASHASARGAATAAEQVASALLAPPAPRASGPATATPLARRAARLHGIALDTLAGSGPRERVTRDDVLRAAGVHVEGPSETRVPAPPATHSSRHAAASAPVVDGRAEVTSRELTRLQRTIARRMAQSRAEVPEFEVQTEVAMDAALALRAELKRAAGADRVVPSLNDLVVKACALALRRHPRANGVYREERFELRERVNVGIAVATDDALVVPVVHDADVKSLGSIAREARALAERVRAGTTTPRDLDSGSFTVSNLGMFGMTAIWPVINAPQAAILGVGALRQTLARHEGEIVDRTLMTLTLSCDHRILYGADAARFLAEVRALLEQPMAIAL